MSAERYKGSHALETHRSHNGTHETDASIIHDAILKTTNSRSKYSSKFQEGRPCQRFCTPLTARQQGESRPPRDHSVSPSRLCLFLVFVQDLTAGGVVRGDSPGYWAKTCPAFRLATCSIVRRSSERMHTRLLHADQLPRDCILHNVFAQEVVIAIAPA